MNNDPSSGLEAQTFDRSIKTISKELEHSYRKILRLAEVFIALDISEMFAIRLFQFIFAGFDKGR